MAALTGSDIAQDALKYQGLGYAYGGNASKPGQWDCVAEGSLVQTTRGAVPIESIRPGDLVTTWQDGKSADVPVAAVLDKGSRACVKVRMRNRAVTVTPDHRLPVLRKSRTGPYPPGGGPRCNVWRVEWIPARSVECGDYIVTLARTPDVGEPISADLAWLAGLFTGDGYFNQRGVRLCVFGELRERARAAVAREFGVTCVDHEREGLIVHGTAARARLEGLGIVSGSAHKRIPEAIWRADAEARRAFLAGYIDADGHCGVKATSLSSCSGELLAGARMLAIGLGLNVSNITCTERTRPIVIKGKTVKNAKPLYTVTMFEGRNNRGPGNSVALDRSGAHRLFADEFFTCERVLAVADAGQHQVYDLMVPGPENFTADGVLVHNCSSFVSYVLGHDFGLTLPGGGKYGSAGYPPGSHGPVVSTYAAWNGATTLPAGHAPAAGDLCVWNGLGPLGHIGIATDAAHMISALDTESGTVHTPIQGYGPAGVKLIYRRLNGAGQTGAASSSAAGTVAALASALIGGAVLGGGTLLVVAGLVLGAAALLAALIAALLGAGVAAAAGAGSQ